MRYALCHRTTKGIKIILKQTGNMKKQTVRRYDEDDYDTIIDTIVDNVTFNERKTHDAVAFGVKETKQA